MDTLLHDLRYTLRALRRSPGFAAVAVLMLALGIGAATALYSVVHGVLLRPLPYPAPERVVQLWQLTEGAVPADVSDPTFLDWSQRTRSFAALAQFQAGVTSVAGGTEPVRRTAAVVSREFFAAMGVRPALGREFLPVELHPGAAPAAIVSHAFWEQEMGADPELGRRSLTFFDRSFTVVGVMPPGFGFPDGAQLWTPRELYEVNPSRTALNWQVVGRLADGVPLATAQREISAITEQLRREHGENRWMAGAVVVPLHEQLTGRVRPVLLALLGAALFLLLIAGANVVNLLLARLATRRRELAVRTALGASGWRLLQQGLCESLLLAGIGGALGALLATWGVPALLALEAGNLPRVEAIGASAPVLVFAAALSLFMGALLGAVAALRAQRADMLDDLAAGLRSGRGLAPRVQGSVVAVQVALTLVLLVGAGLLGRTLLSLLAVDPGFRTTGVVSMTVSLSGMGDEPARMAAFHDELLARLRALPGVDQAGGTDRLPLSGTGRTGVFILQQHPDEISTLDQIAMRLMVPEHTGSANYRRATDGYFQTLGIPLLRGRLFHGGDDPDAPHVALISESLARAHWPGEDPLGRLIQFGNMDGDLRPFTVIGVVGDVRVESIDVTPTPTVYVLHRQRPSSLHEFTLVMRGPAGADAMIAGAGRILREMAPDVAPRFDTVEQLVAAPLAPRRFSMLLLGVFGACALVLAVAGIYGVTTYAVTQRTREIGIRIALGAQGADVLTLVLVQGAVLAIAGVVIGVASALVFTRTLSHLLYGVSSNDPLTFAGAAVLLVAVALLASYLPARRAARVDPMIALRTE